MQDRYTDRLSDYVDDEDLDPRERAEIGAHLESCSECRTVLGELRAVAARAASLPDTAPAANLWAGVADRINASTVVPFRARARRRLTFTIPQFVAASLALMVLSGGMVWLSSMGGSRTELPAVTAVTPSEAEAPAAPRPANFADFYYDEAIADLERTLEAGRQQLDPQTVRVLEENLAAIDRAIDQSRSALSKDPANAFLNAHLAAARNRKLALLRNATALTNKS
jgi:hypothetical protein